MIQILVTYKIKIKSDAIKSLVKMTRSKIKWRKRLEAAPKLKKLNCKQSPMILTRSELHDLLFINCL